MKTFFQIVKECNSVLSEKTDNANAPGEVSQNTRGVMHELLVGKHLNGGKHMDRHVNEHGETPEQTHNRLKAQIHPKDYESINAGAKSAAEHIKGYLNSTHQGHVIHSVVHTSKPGDTEKVTGIKATQKQDSSDIYVTTKHKNTIKHHGISLKVSEGSGKIPASSLGAESAGSKAKHLHAAHHAELKKQYPQLASMSKDERKTLVKGSPKLKSELAPKHRHFLSVVAKSNASELQGHINSGNHHHVVSRIRDLLHAHKTPAQEAGHNFFKHTTNQSSTGFHHHVSDPSVDHEHILKDPKNISVEAKGTSVHYLYKGTKFATQTHKLGSQSDPLSSLKTVGKST
jgi:hypothetical protein